MEKEKDEEGNSEKWSKDHINDKEGMGRSFECNFCKRGFTNAQALGGHMNIHRRDKSKSKSKPEHPSLLFQKLDYFSTNPPCLPLPLPPPPTNSSHYYLANPSPHCHYAIPGPQTNYDNPTMYHSYGYYEDDLKNTHLNLQVGSSRVKDGVNQRKEKDDQNEDPLDLELRLGQLKRWGERQRGFLDVGLLVLRDGQRGMVEEAMSSWQFCVCIVETELYVMLIRSKNLGCDFSLVMEEEDVGLDCLNQNAELISLK
ncbi:hypothetical protein Ancab_013180 [Ancistrocladus abbreviatus]